MVRAMRSKTVTRRRLTADEYHRMARAGILHEDDRLELIDGELMQMAALGGPHVTCVMRLTHWFTPRVMNRAIVSVQNSFRLSEYSEPEPDITLLKYREDFYGNVLPSADDVHLIIEVSDATLRHDRDTTLPLYAAAGIQETWIVDLRRRRLLVYHDPAPSGYRQSLIDTQPTAIAPVAFPDLEIPWEDIFGRA